MVGKQFFRIIGSGHYFPRRRIEAEEMDQLIGARCGWTREGLGIDCRYKCESPETMISMGVGALEAARCDAGVSWNEIDLIIDCTTSRYRPIPCNAAHYAQALGAQAASIPCFDVQSTCLGFATAIQVANGFFAAGTHKTIAIVAAEDGLAGVNWQNAESAGLIGDGAGAVVLCGENTPVGGLVIEHETWAEHLDLCKVDGGGHYLPPFAFSPKIRSQFEFQMDGPALFRLALRRLPALHRRAETAWSKSNHFSDKPPERSHIKVVPHQASPRSLELMRQKLGVPADRFFVDMAAFGNLIAASLPVMIDRTRRDGRIRRGDAVMLLGTSAGYSQIAVIFTL